jgi:hypothetical protein
MHTQFRLGEKLYYVPKHDSPRGAYLTVTRLHLSLTPPLITLEGELVISPKVSKSGIVAEDRLGSCWVSKEAFEAHLEHGAQPIWRRLSGWVASDVLQTA